MQITRKRKDAGCGNNTRIYVSYTIFFSAIALLLGILNAVYEDGDHYNYSKSDSSSVTTTHNDNINNNAPPVSIGAGSSSLRGVSSSKTSEQQQTIIAQSKERVEKIIPPPTKARLNKPPSPQSSLKIYHPVRMHLKMIY